jgi:hypothetical protein
LYSAINQKVEYYLAKVKRQDIQVYIYPNTFLTCYFYKGEEDNKKYYKVGFYHKKEYEEVSLLVQVIFISEDLEKIYEYNMDTEELTEFENK